MLPSASPDADAQPTDRPVSMILRWTRRAVGRIAGERRDDAAAQAALPDGLLDALPDPVVLVDAEDRICAVNQIAEAAFGAAPGVLIGERFAERIVGPQDRDPYRARLARAVDPSEEEADEEPLMLGAVHADGTDVPVAVTLSPIRDSALVAVTLRHAKAARAGAIDDRRRTLRTILDTLPEAIVAVDPAGRVLFRNRASAGGRVRSPEALRPLTEAEWHTADAVMRSGQPAVGEERTDASGGVRLTTRLPVRSASGAVVGLVALSRDVTAEKADAARLLDDKRAAEAAARANSEVLATTSHEVRTLMSGVTGMTQLLLSTDLQGDQRDYVETIRTSSATLLRIVNDVLDLSKMDAGMLSLEREPFQIASVVEGALAVVVQQAGAKGVTLSREVDEAVPASAMGDAGRIQQVLANLLTNAVKFTDEGAVQLRVGLTGGGRLLGFAVEDTGVGIAPDRLDAVFERFVQADTSTSRTHGGTGLGLAICRRLVEQMGGELTADSSPGGGSVFRFTVPLDPVEAPAPDAAFVEVPEAVAPVPVAPVDAPEPVAPVEAPEPIAPVEAREMILPSEMFEAVPPVEQSPHDALFAESLSAEMLFTEVPPAAVPEASAPEMPPVEIPDDPAPTFEAFAPSESPGVAAPVENPFVLAPTGDAPAAPSPSEPPAEAGMPVEAAPPVDNPFDLAMSSKMPDEPPPAVALPSAPPAAAAPVETPPEAEAPPAAAPPASAPPSGTPTRPPRSTVMDTGSILPAARVLLVEDDPVMQKVTSHTLLRLGYRPTVVSNGAQGVMAARGKPYDVILMDIMMPVMDGLDATRKIREDAGPYPQPAIVMLTANAMKGDRVRGMEAGADAYLTKPVEPRELAATIEQAIRSRTAPDEAEAGDAATSA